MVNTMKLESGRITPFQYMLSVACFLQSSAMLSAFFSPITRQDSWLVVIFGMIVAIPELLVFVAIMRSFPGKNLIEIAQDALGRVGGTIVSLMLIWFFLTLGGLNLRDFAQFTRQVILVQTPTVAVVSLCMLLCAYAVLNGIKVATRYAPVFSLMAIMLVVLATILTLNLMDFKNFLPILSQEPLVYVHSTNIVLSIPFGELILFLMISPSVSRGKRGMGAYLFGGFFIGSATIVSVVARDTAVLGRVGTLFALPSFETLRMIRITESLNRLEILFAIVLIVLLFFKITIIFYASVMAIAQLLRLKSYHPLVMILAAFIVGYSTFVFPSAEVHTAYSRDTSPILWVLFEFLLPLLILVVGRARGLHKQPQLNGMLN